MFFPKNTGGRNNLYKLDIYRKVKLGWANYCLDICDRCRSKTYTCHSQSPFINDQ